MKNIMKKACIISGFLIASTIYSADTLKKYPLLPPSPTNSTSSKSGSDSSNEPMHTENLALITTAFPEPTEKKTPLAAQTTHPKPKRRFCTECCTYIGRMFFGYKKE